MSPTVEVAFLDRDGVIEWVNGAWDEFCVQNGGDPARAGVGTSYLAVCDATADDPATAAVGRAIRTAIDGDLASPVTVRIACDSPTAARWFDVLIAPRDDVEGNLIGASVSLAASPAPTTTRMQDRMWALVRAIGAVSGEPELRVALLHVAEAARELGDASLAGLQLRADDGTPGCSVTVGIDDAPSADPAGTLGVPIRLGDVELGRLTLTGSRRGEFTAQDEELVTALAQAAAVAIGNARRHDRSERRRHWQEAAIALAHELISGVADRRPTEVVLDHALVAADGDRAELAMISDDDRVVVTAVAGVASGSAGSAPDDGGPMLAVPITTAPGETGVLSVARARGRPGFGRGERDLLAEFARNAGRALQRGRARADRESLALIEDHDRIAADLHDHVIGELFVTGMGLQAMVADLDRPDQQARVLRLVEDLDTTIRQIRASIFQMGQEPAAQPADDLSTDA